MRVSSEPHAVEGRTVGRYVLFDELAMGGMASVHLGRLVGPAGFARTVAIKRLHPHLARDREFAAMLHDEARLASRVRHPNVVPVLDVVEEEGELLLVMELVQGESLAGLLHLASAEKERLPIPIVRAVMASVLHALHAAHETKSEDGEPLGIVHRDVSPQNVMVGVDGVARVLDFGIAKAAGRLQTTESGEVKGKAAYMAPEQLQGAEVDRRTDVYSASVVLWELLTGTRLFTGDAPAIIMTRVITSEVKPPSSRAPQVPPDLDAIVMKGLARDPQVRWETARDMAIALEESGEMATARAIGEYVEALAAARLQPRAARIAEIESATFERPSKNALPKPRPEEGTAKEPWTQDARPAAKGKSGLALFALALLVGGASGFALFRDRLAKPAPAVSASAPEPVVVVSATASAPATASAAASAPATASATASASASAPPVRVVTKPPPVRPRCDPPYTLDSRGIRIPKPECL